MKLFTKDKDFYRSLLQIAIPITLQSLVMFGVNVTDTVMLGSLGESSIAGSAIANQFSFLYLILCFGISGGMGVLTAQFWGKGDKQAISLGLSIILRIASIAGFLFFLASFFFPKQIMGIYSTDADVIREGAAYMRVLSVSYVCSGISVMIISVLRSVGVVKLTLATNCVALVLNIFLNWIFIFGNLGAPKLGTAGAALATAICRVVEFLIIIVYLLKFDRQIEFKLPMLKLWDKEMFRNYFKNGVPVIVSDLFLGVGSNMLSVVLGRMGPEVMSASSIANVVYQLTSVFLMGISNASGVITGNVVGAGNYEKAKSYGKTFLTISVGTSFFGIILIQLVKGFAFEFFDVTEETRGIALQILDALSVICVFMTISTVLTKGILRAGGDTKFLMIADVLFLWVISIPLGFFTGLYLGFPAWIVFLCLRSDEILKSIWCVIRFFSWKWIRNVAVRSGGDGDSPSVKAVT
jgi:putative efflux protein, MATE family